MKTNFTPGPWKVARWDRKSAVDGFATVITDSRGHGIAQFNQFGHSKKVNANAKLMSASPEMFSALEDIVKEFERMQSGKSLSSVDLEDSIRIGRQIIKNIVSVSNHID